MAVDKLAFGGSLGGFTARSNSLTLAPTRVTGPSGFSAFIYQCWLNVDWDGAHRCYGLNRPDTPTQKFPLQKNLQPWERPDFHGGSLNHARVGGSSSNRWSSIVVRNRKDALDLLAKHYPGWMVLNAAARDDVLAQFWDNRTSTPFGSLEDAGSGRFPIVQMREMGQPAPGYYVSMSHAFTGTYSVVNEWDQNLYWDAGIVPYGVVPRIPGVRKGDYGLVVRNKTGDSTAFFFGDTGGKNGSTRLGESSGFIYLALGESEDEPYSFIVFPGSGSGTADGESLGKMDAVVRGQLTKIAKTGNALAERLAPREPQLLNVRRALFEWGGPPQAYDKELSRYPREHGGPETRDEDSSGYYPESNRRSVTGY
jgi:hypothetical protein